MSFATKRIGPPCCTLFTFVTCCSLQIILSQDYLLPLISVLAENTLVETAYHFLLLLVGFDTLIYRKDYDRSPILVGHQDHVRGLTNVSFAKDRACSACIEGKLHEKAHPPKTIIYSKRPWSSFTWISLDLHPLIVLGVESIAW